MATNLSVHARNRLISALTSQRAASEIQNILEVVNPAVGDIWYVDSVSGSNSNDGKTSDRAFATLDYAIGQSKANNGDVIYLLPGHAETISASAGVNIDVAGLTIISLGRGSNRATFTFDIVLATISIPANNTSIHNMLFKAGIDNLTAPILLTGIDCAIIDCECRDDTGFETSAWIVSGGASDRLLIDGLRYIHEGGTGGSQGSRVLDISGADGTEIRNCFIVSDGSTACINVDSGTHVNIHHNYAESTNAQDVAIKPGVNTTGAIHHNILKIATDAELTWISASNCALFENYGVNDNGETGKLIGTVSS